jgi:hypothetical protein
MRHLASSVWQLERAGKTHSPLSTLSVRLGLDSWQIINVVS